MNLKALKRHFVTIANSFSRKLLALCVSGFTYVVGEEEEEETKNRDSRVRERKRVLRRCVYYFCFDRRYLGRRVDRFHDHRVAIRVSIEGEKKNGRLRGSEKT